MVSILLQLVEEGEAAIIRVGVQQPLCWMEWSKLLPISRTILRCQPAVMAV
jgi:translation elongation factor EF-1alpha